MAKQSPAKLKKLAAQAKRAGAERRAQKKTDRESSATKSENSVEPYDSLDGHWRELGLAPLARHALVDVGLIQLSDLRKVSLAGIKEVDGMEANSIRILISEMKKADLTFRK